MAQRKPTMLGEISVKDLHGPWIDFMCKLQTNEGTEWFEAFKRFLRKEDPWPPKWREEDGVIYFSVTSDGTTGEDWITRLESKGFRVGDYAKQTLRTPSFKPTSGMTTEVAVLRGGIFHDDDRTTSKICAFAAKRMLGAPNAEVACLIREKFTNKEIEAMGLMYIVAMHEPVSDSDGLPSLLVAFRNDDGHWLDAYDDRPDDRWDRDDGFAFAVSQD